MTIALVKKVERLSQMKYVYKVENKRYNFMFYVKNSPRPDVYFSLWKTDNTLSFLNKHFYIEKDFNLSLRDMTDDLKLEVLFNLDLLSEVWK